jgi:hypothetical protein
MQMNGSQQPDGAAADHSNAEVPPAADAQQQQQQQQLLCHLLPLLLDQLRDTLLAQHKHHKQQDKGDMGESGPPQHSMAHHDMHVARRSESHAPCTVFVAAAAALHHPDL